MPPRNSEVKLFLVVSLIIFSFLISFQSCQNPNEPIRKEANATSLEKINLDSFPLIKQIAKSLALFSSNMQNRKIIENAIKESNKKEQILEASEFLNKSLIINSKTTTLRDNISLFLPKKERNNFQKAIAKLQFGLFDIYFPLEKWRKNWTSKDELLVAAVGYRKDSDKSKITAYDLQGNEVLLSAERVPAIPTLVVYPSEKRGQYKEILVQTSNFNTKKINSTNSVTNNYSTKTNSIYIKKNYDNFWFGGAMEIYLKIKTRIGAYGYYGGWVEKGLGDVYANQAKYITVEIASHSTSDYYMQVEIWEDDGWGSGNDNLVADVTYNEIR